MPTWGETLQQINVAAAQNDGQPNVDQMRLAALQRITGITGRPVVSYYSAFLTVPHPVTSINLQDMQGMMEVFKGLSGPNLDIILHSPGGQAEATESIVRHMRSRYDHVRVFVPLVAMSAATLWAMSANQIVLGKHSQLGPIDPQVTIPSVGMPVPAGALIEQFQQAVDECSADPGRVAGWLPTLQQFPPGLLNICQSATELSKTLVRDWLARYMMPGNTTTADEVASWLANDKEHLSHSRAIRREDLSQRGVAVLDLEEDEELQDAVLTLHHLTMHTLDRGVLKIIENSQGARFAVQGQLIQGLPPSVAMPPVIPQA